MRILLTAISLALYCASCISAGGDEDTPTTFAYNVMASSSWEVTDFQLDSVNLTDSYTDYRLNFYDTGALDAEITPGSSEATGIWSIISGETINSDRLAINFLSSDSLSLFNGNWTITNITVTRVNCERNEGEKLTFEAL